MVRSIQFTGEKNNYLSQQDINEALDATSKALIGTALEDIVLSLDDTGSWWVDFVDKIVDKLSLVEDSRFGKYKLQLHKLIDDSKVIDLSMYGSPLAFAKRLFT